jgi:hypothetical protein
VGDLEDQFFATVFLASGLLFVTCPFDSVAVMEALVESVWGSLMHRIHEDGRGLHVSTCTIGLRSAIFPRWMALVGYAVALVLLVVIANLKWITLVFPIWMLLVSSQMLSADFHSRTAGTADVENYPAQGPGRHSRAQT